MDVKNVQRFEELQKFKVQRAKRLLGVLIRIIDAGVLGEEQIVKQGLDVLNANLEAIVGKAKDQLALCKDSQCQNQLVDEIHILTSKNKDLGMSVVDHVRLAARGAEFSPEPVRKALSLIIAREESLLDLLHASLKH